MAPADDSGGHSDLPALPAGARVLDDVVVVDASGAREGVAVVLDGSDIFDVVPAGGPWPDDAEVLDLGGKTVVPGLIDAHVHLFHAGTITWVGDALASNLAAQLQWGVTGVADLGAPEQVFALRDRIAAGEIVGPRIFATGPFLTAEGSHPCETFNDLSLCRYVDGDGDGAVGELNQADGIKVALADAAFTDWPTPRLDLGDLQTIVEAAHDASQPVFAHIDASDDATDALTAGVDVLAHPVFAAPLDEAPDGVTLSTVGAFSGTPELVSGALFDEDLSATSDAVVSSWRWWSDHPDAFVEGWVEGSEGWAAAARANLALAVAEGQPVIAGSDAGYWFVPHGVGLHRELSELVAAGMEPLEALGAATSAPAALLGWEDLGFVAAGYRADLVVVEGRPDEDITALRNIEAVFLGGQRYAGGPLRQSGDAEPGGFCLEDADCAGACDLVHHTCTETCEEPFDRAGSCDDETWCAPQDGLSSTTTGVCAEGSGCDLYNQDCEPASYGEACVPADLDTNLCWPAGPQGEGEVCSWTDSTRYCEQGLFCSWVDYTCYRLCDPDGAPTCDRCVRQTVEGEDWFGLCL